jgi:aminoglycoside 3-N-acetyltransferase
LTVTQADISGGLRALGLSVGDVVFAHSSLGSFGYVDGGANTVVRALVEVLGPGGTLSVPTFHRYFAQGPDQVWDRPHTPSRMGQITETVRTWSGAYRSAHAVHPIAAVGALARDIADRDHETDFDEQSTFQRLIDHEAWILLMGVTYQNCTHIHVVEERLIVPYRHWIEYAGTVIDGEVRTFKTYRFLAKYSGLKNDFLPLGHALESEGKVRTHVIVNSTMLLFKAQDIVDLGLEKVTGDPLFLIHEDSKKEASRYLLK